MKYLTLLLSLFIAIQSFSQQTIVYPDSAHEVLPISTFITSDGGMLIVSNYFTYYGTSNPHHGSDITVDLIKTDANGTMLWNKKNQVNAIGWIAKVFIDQNDNITLFANTTETVICGLFGIPNANRFRMLKYDALGNEILNINLVPICKERFIDVVEVPNGFIVNSDNTSPNNHTIKTFIDHSGNILWTQNVTRNGERNMVVFDNTLYVVVGSSIGLSFNLYNLQGQPTGTIATSMNNSIITDFKVTSDNNFLILSEYSLTKVTPSGTTLWSKQFSTLCSKIIERSDNHLYLYKQDLNSRQLEINLLSPLGDSLSSDFYGNSNDNRSGDIILAPNGIDYIASGSVGCCFQDPSFGSGDAAIFTTYGLGTNNEDINTFKSTIYPNPTDKLITINLPKIPSNKLQFELFDLSGKNVYKSQLVQKETSIEVPEQLKGYFIYRIMDGHKISSGKLVIH